MLIDWSKLGSLWAEVLVSQVKIIGANTPATSSNKYFAGDGACPLPESSVMRGRITAAAALTKGKAVPSLNAISCP